MTNGWRFGWMLAAASPWRTAARVVGAAGCVWVAAGLATAVLPVSSEHMGSVGRWMLSYFRLMLVVAAAALPFGQLPRHLPVSAVTGAAATFVPTAIAAALALTGAGLLTAFPDEALAATRAVLARWPNLLPALWPDHTRLGPAGDTAHLGLAPLVHVAAQLADVALLTPVVAWHALRFGDPRRLNQRWLAWLWAVCGLGIATGASTLALVGVGSVIMASSRAPELFGQGSPTTASVHRARPFLAEPRATLRDVFGTMWQSLRPSFAVAAAMSAGLSGCLWAVGYLDLGIILIVSVWSVLTATLAATLGATFAGPAPLGTFSAHFTASGALPQPALRLVAAPLLIGVTALGVVRVAAALIDVPLPDGWLRFGMTGLWTAAWAGWWLHAGKGPVRWLHLLANLASAYPAYATLEPELVALHAGLTAATAVHVIRRGH